MKIRKSLKGIMAAVIFFMAFMVGNSVIIKAEDKYKAYSEALVKAIDNNETVLNLESQGISIDEYNSFYLRFFKENPRYFYIEPGVYFRDHNNIVVKQNLNYSSTAKEDKDEYEKKVSSILKQVNKRWSDFEKVLFINDYLAYNCSYDTTLKAAHSSDVYGALVNQSAVCQGYSMAFMDLMDRLSIPCEYASSTSLNHAWNMVKIDGDWYQIDVTWNDPVPNMEGRVRHFYLLKSSEWFKNEGKHNASDYVVTGDISFNDAKNKKYDNYFWNNIDVPFSYYAKKWYAGVDKETGEMNSYVYKKKKGGFVKKETLFTIEDVWHVWDSDAFYVGCFSQNVIYKGRIYYSTPDKIYSYDIKSGETALVHTDGKKTGYIYGLKLKRGKLTYILSRGPGKDVTGRGSIKL